MENAGRHLQQLCLAAKSNAEINHKVHEWLADTDVAIDLYQCNRSFESDFRTALRCLLNSYHATEVTVEKFLFQQSSNMKRVTNEHGSAKEFEHRISRCESNRTKISLHDQDLNGITALHVATYRNSLHVDKIAKVLLEWENSSNKCLNAEPAKESSLASIPMECGSYPLHILTGQNLTIKDELLETLLCADPSIPFKDDVNGDNPISLLWKNTLRFRWAISVMEGATFIDYIKNGDCSWMAIITPYQFIEFSLRMAAAALYEERTDRKNRRQKIDTLHDVCRIPRCPPMLLRLLQTPEYKALFGVRGSAYTVDEYGMLPIHHAVQNPPVSYRFVPSYLKSKCKKSLVEMLLEENPGSVKIADNEGRLPLHYALEGGCVSERDLMALVRLFPDSLRIEDPRNGLLPFMMVSTISTRIATSSAIRVQELENEQQGQSLTQGNSNITAGEKFSSTRQCQAEWKRDNVKMTYLLLMLCPDVISSQSAG